MAAVTSTASLCPAGLSASSSSSSSSRLRTRSTSSHGKRQATTACQCLPARVEVVTRREALLSVLLSGAAASSVASVLVPADALAEATESQDGFSTYEDAADKFRLTIPQGWLVGTGQSNSFKAITAFYPEQKDADTNVSVVITGIGPDFTSLKSFGDVDAFAENLVNGLDRSWQRPAGLTAKLVDSRAANGLYYVEYTMQNPGERKRHICSVVGMAFNGWYNRLYTVSGQYIDDEADKYRTQIVKAVQSFRLT